MGFLAPAEPVAEVLTVATALGRATLLEGADGPAIGQWPKARVFVLADRTAVLVTPSAENARAVDRQTFDVEASDWSRSAKVLTVVTSDGQILSVSAKGCGCGMGIVGNAGPTAEAYRLVKVRAPEWHTDSP